MPNLCYFLKIMLPVTEIMLLTFYTDFIRKIKIISGLTLSILTLMNFHMVHLIVQSYSPKHRKYACA